MSDETVMSMSADDCRSYRGDLAAYALDRLDDLERTRLLAHLDRCADCRFDLEELRLTALALPAASLAHLNADHAPSLDLAERIAQSARTERTKVHRLHVRRAVVAAVSIAAALILAVVAFGVVREDSPTASLQPFAVAPNGAMASFGLQKNDQGTQVRLHHRGLDPNSIYWVWLTDVSGQRFNAGTFRGTWKDETITLQSALPPEDTVRVWCTDAGTNVVLDSWLH